MKKVQKPATLPISQRDLAAYLGISPSLLNMTETGRHGVRQLSAATSLKLASLVAAHQKPRRPGVTTPTVKNIKDLSITEASRHAQKLIANVKYARARLPVLKDKLSDMVSKQQECMRWINTVDNLLEALPKNKESTGDRLWLENQQQRCAKKLSQNDLAAQLKLEVEIETEKAKIRINTDMAERLLRI